MSNYEVRDHTGRRRGLFHEASDAEREARALGRGATVTPKGAAAGYVPARLEPGFDEQRAADAFVEVLRILQPLTSREREHVLGTVRVHFGDKS